MILSQNDLISRILETQAVSIWDHQKGPIFWYAAGTPGPFYVNTEKVLGPALAQRLLDAITAIVESVPESAARAEKLEDLIIRACAEDSFYQSLIDTMAEKVRAVFPDGSFSLISGGERRDWLFSIPLARKLGVAHLYLFKNGSLFCSAPIPEKAPVLHVSDLINNAASHFDSWFPILEKNNLHSIGTACVNTRGSNGLDRLRAIDHTVAALNHVALPFFEACAQSGLIDGAVVKEIALFFDDPKAWASAYVMANPALFDIAKADKKSFARICAFIQKDPWQLRSKHQAFFETVEAAIRLKEGKE